jgi:hypothetical protein
MGEIQIKTMTRIPRRGEPEVVISMTWVPRGSGNRYKVRKMASYFKTHPELKRVVKRVVIGTTRLTVHVRPCLDFFEVLAKVQAEAKARRADVDQMKLFSYGERQFE